MTQIHCSFKSFRKYYRDPLAFTSTQTDLIPKIPQKISSSSRFSYGSKYDGPMKLAYKAMVMAWGRHPFYHCIQLGLINTERVPLYNGLCFQGAMIPPLPADCLVCHPGPVIFSADALWALSSRAPCFNLDCNVWTTAKIFFCLALKIIFIVEWIQTDQCLESQL